LLSYSADGFAEEDSSLGIFELLHSTTNLPTPKTTRNPAHPVDEKMWASWFAKDGRPTVTFEDMKKEIFRRGINPKGSLRQKIWPHLLGVYEWDTTAEEREKLWQAKKYAFLTL
jgi:hypothetical protein